MLTFALLLCLQLAPSRAEGDVPVEFPLPAGVNTLAPLKVVRADTGEEIRAQLAGSTVLILAANDATAFKIVPGMPAPHSRVEWTEDQGQMVASFGDRKLCRYNRVEIPQPDPVYSRNGYLHPIWTPTGKVVTNDAPKNHLHHHGIWSAWTSSEFEGRKSSFWDVKALQGRVEGVKVEDVTQGPVYAGFKATLRSFNLNGPSGPKAALDEVWEVRVYALSDRCVIDLTSTQTAATDQPLVIKEYRYGGVGFRGSLDWEGKTGLEFLTSEGKGRIDGHATKAKWVLATGKIGGAEASVGFLCHPSNFRHPQPLRIHPDEPFFNWAVPQGGDFSIEPGKPYIARYRFIVADGRLTADRMNAEWSAYGEPSKATLSAAK